MDEVKRQEMEAQEAKKEQEQAKTEEPASKEDKYPEPSENWAHETVQELLDFWEEQGVYIRE